MNKKIYKTIKILFLSTVFALLAPADGYALPIDDEVTGFSIEAKFKIKSGAAAVLFSAESKAKFLMWQTSISGSNLVFTPYSTTNGTDINTNWNNLGSFTITGGSTSENAVHTIRIEVKNNQATTVIDEVTVDANRPCPFTGEDYLFGQLGFREWNNEEAFFDDIKVTATYENTGTFTTFETDFSGSINPFFNSTLEDGWLNVKGPTNNGTTYAWQKPEYASFTKYTVDMDFEIEALAAGPVFGAEDASNFYMWQISSTQLSCHYWKGGSINTNTIVRINLPTALTSGSHHLRIAVDGNKASTYIDNVLVDDRENPNGGGNYGYGATGIGFRADKNGSNPEKAYYDNVVVRAEVDGQWKTLLTESFSDTANYAFTSSTVGTVSVVDGRLHLVGPSSGNSSLYSWQQDRTASEITWTGDNNATWGDGDNWNNDTVPGTTATVVIPDSAVLSLSADVEVGKIWLGENVRINSGEYTLKAGEVKIDFIVAKEHEWYSIGFPFQIDRIDAEDWRTYLTPADDDGATGNFWLQEYNGTNNEFVPVTAFPLEANKGYIIQFPDGYEGTRITFVSAPVNHTNSVIEATPNTYQLLANPTLGNYTLPTDDSQNYYVYDSGPNMYLRVKNEVVTLRPFEAAVTIKATTGTVWLSSIGDGSNGLTGIEGAAIETNDPVIATRYYTVQGAEIKQPSENGMYIIRKIHASQKEDVSKIIYIKK